MTPAPRPTPPHRDELEGFLEGVAYRVRRRAEEGRPQAESERLLASARAALTAGDLEAVERDLRAADRHLDRDETELELSEHPRGLVGYVPRGERGRPPERAEEPLSNRLVIVERLLSVVAARGERVEVLAAELARAEQAYLAGDRELARRLCDRVHAELDRLVESPGSRHDPR